MVKNEKNKLNFEWFSLCRSNEKVYPIERDTPTKSQENPRMFGNYWSCAIQLIFLSFEHRKKKF